MAMPSRPDQRNAGPLMDAFVCGRARLCHFIFFILCTFFLESLTFLRVDLLREVSVSS